MAAGTRRILSAPGAGAVIENILAGSPLEYPGVPSSLEIYGSVIAAGGTEVTMDVMIGTEMVAEGLQVPIEYALNEGPRVPDHQLLVDAVGPADHVQIRLRNAGAAARNCVTLVRIQPV